MKKFVMLVAVVFLMGQSIAFAETVCPEGREVFSGSEKFCPTHGVSLEQVPSNKGGGSKTSAKQTEMEGESAAADQKQAAEDYYGQGMKYYFGDGVPSDMVKAVELLHRAAEAGHVEAMAELGGIYLLWGNDYQKGAEWTNKAVALNNATGHYYLAVMNHYGMGIEQDFSRAAEIYEKLIDKPSPVQDSALQALADLYLNGAGVEKDPVRAEALLKAAAENGRPAAQYVLAGYYFNGSFGKADLDLAHKYYGMAAKSNYSDAEWRYNMLSAKLKNINQAENSSANNSALQDTQ